MTRRCLIAFSAQPQETGAADWRRVVILSAFYREIGFEATGLRLWRDAPTSPVACALLRGVVDRPAFAAFSAGRDAVAELHRRWRFDVVHYDISASEVIDSGLDAALICDAAGRADGERADAIALSFGGGESETGSIEGALLRRAFRFTRSRLSQERILAGCWVEDDPRSVAAARALFAAILRQGGGYAPFFALAGPGAASVDPPRLPHPVTVLDDETPEKVFYRGVDIALFPDAATGASAALPRYEAIAALELGATPLVTDAALIGVKRAWRLPRFQTVEALADFLLENGRALSEGGLMAELRARADWTWSGIAEAAGRQREALAGAIWAKIAEREG